jgi:hypothetical protein
MKENCIVRDEAHARELNADGFNIYRHVNAGYVNDKGRVTEASTTHVNGHQVDVDPPEWIAPYTPEYDQWKATTVASLSQTATRVVASGRGLQGFWEYEQPQPVTDPADIEWVKRVNRALRHRFDGDKAAVDVARIMKEPGYTAWPDEAKAAAGWRDAPVEVVADTGRTYSSPQAFGAMATDGLPEDVLAGTKRSDVTIADDSTASNYAGPPEDDDALLQLIGRNRLHPDAILMDAFMNGNDVILGNKFPSNDPKKPYDGSEADLSFANLLAFWTGCNPARMWRIMQRSAMVRDKWNRMADYVLPTIQTAIGDRVQTGNYYTGTKPKGVGDLAAAGQSMVDAYNARVASEIAGSDKMAPTHAAAVRYAHIHAAMLEEYNRRFYIIENHHGALAVFDRLTGDYQRLREFAQSHIGKQMVIRISAKGVPTMGATADWWLKQEEADRFAYSVHAMDKPMGEFINERGDRVRNFFEGWACNPTPGPWPHIHRYLWEFICGQQQDRFDWVMAYLSQMLCDPVHKPPVGLVLMSEETGTGKGTFYDLVTWLLGEDYTLLVDDPEQVLGQWSVLLEHKVFVAFDEAIASNDRKSTRRIMSMVTNDKLVVNEKHEKQRTGLNTARLAFLTNDHWAKSVAAKDRRDVIMRVPGWFENGVKVTEATGWGWFRQAMRAEVDAFAAALLQMGITRDTMPHRLLTAEHAEQVQQSFEGVQRIAFEILQAGKIVGCNHSGGDIWVDRLSLADTAHELRLGQLPKNAGGTGVVNLFCGKEVVRRTIPGTEAKAYKLPPLEVARQNFQHMTGAKSIDWGDDGGGNWVRIFSR